MHRGGEGFTTPGAAGHWVAATPDVRLLHRICRRHLRYSGPGVRPKAVRKVEAPCRVPAVEALNFYLGTSGADVVPGQALRSPELMVGSRSAGEFDSAR